MDATFLENNVLPIELYTMKQIKEEREKYFPGSTMNEADETFLDLSELFCFTEQKPEFIEVFNSDKAFSMVINNPDYEIFEHILNDVVMKNIIVIHVRATLKRDNDIEYESIVVRRKVDSKVQKRTYRDSSKKLQLQPHTALYVELSHEGGEFGHYGVFVVKNDVSTVEEFDSMMTFDFNAEKNIYTPDSAYTRHFRHVFTDIFNLTSSIHFTSIVWDEEYSPYSMEITGGSLNVVNQYIRPVANTKIHSLIGSYPKWLFKIHAFGPDNQNQNCYMWSLFYLLSSLFVEGGYWRIHKEICRRNIIPLVFIKSFNLAILKRYRYVSSLIQNPSTVYYQIPHIRPYLQNYDLIISNSDSYIGVDGIFNFIKKTQTNPPQYEVRDFELYKVTDLL